MWPEHGFQEFSLVLVIPKFHIKGRIPYIENLVLFSGYPSFFVLCFLIASLQSLQLYQTEHKLFYQDEIH